MVAATYGERPCHLRLVVGDEREVRPGTDLTYLRRRLVAVGVLVLFLVAMGAALGRAASQRAGATVGTSRDAADVLPIAQREYIVQPGDTLWKIARALQPAGDIRPLVYELGKARGGAPLRVGERIEMP